MANGLGDFDTSTVVYGKFTTVAPTTGAPGTLGGSPVLSVYKDNSTTQSTAGVTLTADFDGVTGLNHFAIDTSADATFYSAGSFFDVVITTGTVGGVSAVGYTVGQFTLRKTAALRPTVAGRTLDVSTGGEAGIDWANVGSPSTSVALSNTNINEIASVGFGAIRTVSFASGAIDGPVIATGAIDASKLWTDTYAAIADCVWDEVLSGHLTASTTGKALSDAAAGGGGGGADPWLAALPGAYGAGTAGNILGNRLDAAVSTRATSAALATVQADTDDIQTRLPAALISGRMDSSVGAMATDVLTSGALATSAVTEIQTGLATSAQVTAISVPTAINNADALLDRADAVEVGLTPRQSLRVALAALGGKVSGGGTTTNTFRNAIADSKNRVVATVDANGNRTAITYDVT